MGMNTMNNQLDTIKQNLVDNCLILNQLFGRDCDLTIIIKEDIVVYGLLAKGKTFWSKQPHKHISTIALYQTNITIAFLSDLSDELLSIVSDKSINRVKPIDSISPNRTNSKTLLQIKINHSRINQGLKPIYFNDEY